MKANDLIGRYLNILPPMGGAVPVDLGGMCCGNSFPPSFLGASLRAWLQCADSISYKEEEGSRLLTHCLRRLEQKQAFAGLHISPGQSSRIRQLPPCWVLGESAFPFESHFLLSPHTTDKL